MAIDDTRLRDLLEQSQDLHSDAMSTTRVGPRRVRRARARRSVARRRPRRRAATALLGGLPKSGVLAAAGLGTAMVALLACPAFADKTMDVQMLQTAASIENLAVATYDTALTLDFIGGASANAVVKAFVQKTKEQHQQHAEAFNAAVTRLGGKAQDQPDPVLLGVVNNAKPSLTGPAEVVDLAIELEDGAAQTYVANTGHVLEQERPLGRRQHHGRRGAARRDPQRGEGARRRRCRRPDRAAARRRQAARRRRERRLPERVLPDHRCPPRERRSSAVRRRNRKQDPIAISEAELAQMTRDLDDAHHDTLPSMRDSLAEWSDSDDDIRDGITRLVSTPSSRRAFLLGGGAVLGGVALVGSGVGSGLAAAATRSGAGGSRRELGPEAQR